MADSRINGLSISVIIPVCNGAKTLPALLEALEKQTVQIHEIIVSDSQSTDDSISICHQFGITPIPLRKEEFDHGGTRSMLGAKATGDILVYLTQDAIPASENSIEQLVSPIVELQSVCCSYGRQLARVDAAFSASSLRSFNYPAKSEIRSFDDRVRYGLKTIFISNSFAAYHREILAEIGCFKNGLIFGEDTCTLGKLLQAGHRVAYVAEACVWHSHNYTILQDFRRSFDNGVLHTMEKWLLETYGGAEKIGVTYIRSQILFLVRSGKLIECLGFIFRAACKYVGYRCGRLYTYIPRKIRPFLSMNRRWWGNHYQ